MAALAICFWTLVVWVALKACLAGRRVPQHLPWAGHDSRPGLFTRLGLYLRSVLSTADMIKEGYAKHSNHGRPFVLPNLFTGAEILLPRSSLDWIHDQPEQRLSSFEAHRQFMMADYTLLHPTIIKEHIFENVIKRQLTRDLDKLESILTDEVTVALSSFDVATDDCPAVADSYMSWKRIVLQVVSSIYVGRPLCRNSDYLNNATRFNGTSMLTAGLINIIPSWLRPILAPIICLPDRYFHWRCAKKTKPLIKARLESIKSTDPEKERADVPVDLITWATRDAYASSQQQNSHKTSVSFLAARISVMNFVSIDSTTITLSNVLFDILSYRQTSTSTALHPQTLFQQLQQEADTAYKLHAGKEGQRKNVLAHLPLLDSCLKESFRLGNFISRSVIRMVMDPDGLQVPGVGLVPQGVKLAVPLWGIQHDETHYDDAYRWRYTRWLQGDHKERISLFGGHASDAGEQYLPFGFRRIICPGRFFAMRVVKLILLQLLLGYDIEMLNEERPANGWLGVSRGPPMGGRLAIRPRKTTVDPKDNIAKDPLTNE